MTAGPKHPWGDLLVIVVSLIIMMISHTDPEAPVSDDVLPSVVIVLGTQLSGQYLASIGIHVVEVLDVALGSVHLQL